MSGSRRLPSARRAPSTTRRLLLLLVIALSCGAAYPLMAQASTWQVGDVFAGVGNGEYNVFDNAGTFKETISDGLGGFTTGCAFNNQEDHLYTTNFSNSKVVVYQDLHPHAIDQVIDTTPPGGLHNESVVFDAAGNFYVGNPDGDADIQKYDAAGTFLQDFDVATEGRGSDWLDLAVDQKTMFYTSEGPSVLRFDVAANTQLANFASVGGNLFALRLLPPGDGSGGLLVANLSDVKRLDASGAVVQSYDAAGEDTWFALNLDPNGTSFWSGDAGTNNFYRFNIATGAVEVGPIASMGSLFGLCLKGEPTAGGGGGGISEGRMTGGGSVFTNSGVRVTHGFQLHCDKARSPNNLQVNWGKGNKFHLESLTSASCTDDPAIAPDPPAAGFDTYKGSGSGRYNGAPATAEWTFKDAGEPGKNDTAEITVKDAGNNVVLTVSGKLRNGNHQAHAE